jgi:predicted PhzF superfamily epimerase YddE/YHI9
VQWVDNGPGWVEVLLTDDEAVKAVRPVDLDGQFIGVVGPGPEHLEVRGFFSVDGACVEDPVTGSLNASVAGWLAEKAVVQFPYEARQGSVIGRDGRIHVDRDDRGIWVGGSTVTCVTGRLAQARLAT